MAKDLRGLTVIEMLVAAGLFAVSLLIMLGVFPVSARAVRRSQETLIATHLAEQQLERARAVSYASLQNSVLLYQMTMTHNGTDVPYDFTVTQTVVPDATDPGLAEVTVDVEWLGDRDSTRRLTLETMIARTTP